MDFTYAQALGVAFLVTLVSTPVTRRLGAMAGLLDHPHERKLQESPIPRTGGIGILIGLLGGLVIVVLTGGGVGVPLGRELVAILAGAVMIHLTGVLDDLLDLPPLGKLAAQAAAVAVVVSQGVVIDRLVVPGLVDWSLGLAAVPVTAFVLLGFVNAVNLVDGLDGLASGVVGIGALLLGLSAVASGNAPAALLSALLLGAILGFLPFNLSHHRKTFLGDAGSMLLGFLLPAIAIAGARFSGDSTGVLVVLGAAAIPVLDTLTTIVRRRRNGVGIFSPDAMHVHHRLIRFGLTPKRTVLVIHAMTLACAGTCVALLVPGLAVMGLVAALSLALAIVGVAEQRRRNVEEAVSGFRDILFYLLGARDGHDPRLRGDVAMAEILADGTVLVEGDGAVAEPARPILVAAGGAPRSNGNGERPATPPIPTPALRLVRATDQVVPPPPPTPEQQPSGKIVAFRRP